MSVAVLEAEKERVEPMEFLSPLFVAVQVPEVNEFLSEISRFIEKVKSEPNGHHDLELSETLIVKARKEMKSYTDWARGELERIQESLEAVLGVDESLGRIRVVTNLKEPPSWAAKVVGRMVVGNDADYHRHLKDMFRIGVIVENEESLESIFEKVRGFFESWNSVPFDLNGSGRPFCRDFICDVKKNFGDSYNPDWLWQGGKFVYSGKIVLECQVKTERFVLSERDPDSPSSHSRYKESEAREIATRAAYNHLPPTFVPFLTSLIQHYLCDTDIVIPLPSKITLIRGST